MSTSMAAIEMTQFGKLPAVRIAAADGAQAIVTLYGAQLVSWKSADGKERLFVSERSALDGSAAIRGGVPVIFPQFAERGDGMRHGFARVSEWRLLKDSGTVHDAAHAVFELTQADLRPALATAWPHQFSLRLRVAVHAGQLQVSLDVRNKGEAAFAFAAALHTYYLVDRIGAVRIDGVQEQTLAVDDKLDMICRDVGGDITLADGAGKLYLEMSGFQDAVVWNPGAADAAALKDLEDSEYHRFVCVEPALIEPVVLGAGQTWHGRHRISVAG